MSEELKISPLTDNVYIVDAKGRKTDVTHQFLFCVISRWLNSEQTIYSPDGTEYVVSVRKSSPE